MPLEENSLLYNCIGFLDSNCIKCKPSYFLDSGLCNQCGKNCANCNNKD
jgi:hypothetical protein